MRWMVAVVLCAPCIPVHAFVMQLRPTFPFAPSRIPTKKGYSTSSFNLHAMPKRGAIVDSYRTVDVSCGKCRTVMFEYKKKNGTKSALVKMFLERIVKDPFNLVTKERGSESNIDINSEGNSNGKEHENCKSSQEFSCPKCNLKFGRHTTIKGLPAIKIVGNRLRMK